MFTGIIEATSNIEHTRTEKGVKSLEISIPSNMDDLNLGESISVNGVCLTVTSIKSSTFSVEVVTGTLSVTYLEHLTNNDKVNLERAMLANKRFGGHFVSGHVDGKGKIKRIDKKADEWIFKISTTRDLLKQMINKGSITIDGISLTIFKLNQDSFDIHIIPETRKRTTLSDKKQGDEVHLETDLLMKYVQKTLSLSEDGLTTGKLLQYGY